ncbi:LVIVD repeat-containing protein [Hugenholtzia roseola]|uniref:LVIVD repeat-containing protein n=1 Tax=Hugenholtzia roseola TaxID=1002 RepID=UPI0006844B85|nr:hypothetical protein [Hugenholtzia roseola]
MQHKSFLAKAFTKSLGIALLFSLFLSSCTEENCTYTYTYYEPIYLSFEDLRSAPIRSEAAQPLGEVGKIYYKDNYIFINERGRGIHLINNSNPSAPINEAFIPIAGNYDIAIAGNTLYADNYTDLLVLDIGDKRNIRLAQRLENAFDQQQFMTSMPFVSGRVGEGGIIVDWKATTVSSNYNCEEDFMLQVDQATGDNRDAWVSTGAEASAGNASSDANSYSPNYGVGGSMARFTLAQGHLYTLNGFLLNTYNILTPTHPTLTSRVEVAFDVETIFPYRNFLFFGSQTGMLLYDNQNPAEPQFISRYDHLNSCDPVVVEGNIAYVTLRSGTNCNNFINELHILDLTNVYRPELLSVQPMFNPHGLGIDRGTLFICDGAQGLKVFDAKNPLSLRLLGNFAAQNAYDVIPLGNTLLLIAADGLYQYDYTDPENLRLLSHLAISK